jgi:hypothetical protein
MPENKFEDNFKKLEEQLTALHRPSAPNPDFILRLERQLAEKAGASSAQGRAAALPYFRIRKGLSGLWRRPALGAALLLVLVLIVVVSLNDPGQVLAQAQRWLGVAPRIDNCTGELGAISVDNLYIPEDSTCTLNETSIKGNIFVRDRATLHAYSVRVEGNLHAKGAALVEVHLGSYVKGNIQLDNSGMVSVDGVQIGGDLQAFGNWGRQTFVNNQIGGDLQAFNNMAGVNTSGNKLGGNLQAFDNALGVEIRENAIEGDLQAKDNTGGLAIYSNIIYGNLQCDHNSPPPTGSGNRVGGDMEGQCAFLSVVEPTPTATATPTVEATATQTATPTVEATATQTATPTVEATATQTATHTVEATLTQTATHTPETAPFIDPGGEDYDCTGNLGEVRTGNLYVPNNATCVLNGTRIEGNIHVYSNASLYAYGVRVEGNIQAERAARVEIHPGSYVDGNLQVDYSGALAATSVRINGNLQAFDNWGSQSYSGNVIGGDLQAFNNSGGVSIQSNSIGGNLQAKDNTGGLAINNNTIYGNLECDGNFPPPTGTGNNVSGDMEGQCKAFQDG